MSVESKSSIEIITPASSDSNMDSPHLSIDKQQQTRKKSDSSGHDHFMVVPSCEDRSRSPECRDSPEHSPKSSGGMKLVPRSPSPSSREPSLDKFAGDSQETNGDLTPSGADFKDKMPEKKSDKKKKNAWYNMLNPNYKSKSDDFKKLFKELPDTERLLVDYSCALQRDILVHGRLYISQNYICFYANIFRWETMLMIKWRDVTSMTKEKTARVIPNAIQITTESEKHFLTSFGARDKTYLMLFRIWQNALMDQPMHSQELWQWVHFSYGEELGLTSDDDDYVAPRSMEDTDIKMLNHNNNQQLYLAPSIITTATESDTNLAPGEVEPALLQELEQQHSSLEHADPLPPSPQPCPTLPKEEFPPTDLSDTTESDVEVESSCGCSSHEGKELFNTVLPLPVDQVFTLVFTGHKFFADLLHYRKTHDLMETPWKLCSEAGHKIRQVTYTLTLNHTMAKSAQTTETQRLLKHSKPGQVYVVDCDIVSSGIPYGDTFTIKSVYCLTRVSSNQCRLCIHGAVLYKKGVWGLIKNLVEKSAIQGLEGYCVDLEEALLKEAERLNQHPSKKSRRRKRTKADSSKNESLPDIPSPFHRGSTFHPLGPRGSMYNLDGTVKIILLALVVLLVINLVLVYKLWGVESVTSPSLPMVLPDQSALDQLSKEDFVQLLRHQEDLHRSETARWQATIQEVIKMLQLIESSLANLKGMVDTYSSGSTATPNGSTEL